MNVKLKTEDNVNYTIENPVNSQFVYKKAEYGRMVPVGILTEDKNLYFFPPISTIKDISFDVEVYHYGFYVESTTSWEESRPPDYFGKNYQSKLKDAPRESINFYTEYRNKAEGDIWIERYHVINPKILNLEDIQEIYTGAEGQRYVIGYIENPNWLGRGNVIFYEQYCAK